jgi:hypothetical protein
MSDEEYQAQINAEAEAAQDYAAQQAEADKSKPDGWVAWHPKIGVSDIVLSLISPDDAKWGFLNVTSCSPPSNWEEAEAEGWRIRPVKLVFLDEVEK